MKALSYLLILIVCLTACNHVQKKNTTQRIVDTVAQVVKTDTVFQDDKDTVVIQNDYDKAVYTRGKLRWILKHYPELNEDALPPDWAYAKAELEGSATNEFVSDVGQDDYYQLYAYFRKAKYGQKKYKTQRKVLINIYDNINSLFDKLTHGGTYFGHQEARIRGYAEYDVQYTSNYQKGYDITRQKELYLSTLKQLIDDEISIDTDTPQNEKPKLKSDLLEIVGDIDSLITNSFYLKMAQQFQYSHY